MSGDEAGLRVEGLSVDFHTAQGTVHAVQDVGFALAPGETLAILGESGSGKSVTAAAIMDLIDSPPGRITAGQVLFEGRDLLKLDPDQRRSVNGEKISMIFQDPLAHLNPVYPVGFQIAETLTAHGVASRSGARERARDLMLRVGLDPARLGAYPHQFSGGQRQRVMIASALALEPRVLIADEPTTALDVTVQAQILDLLRELQRETGTGLLLITHDLGVVADIADRVVVMHRGRVVEEGPVGRIFRAPGATYTRRLLDAVPGRGAPRPAEEHAGDPPLLEVEGLVKHYPITRGVLRRATGEVVRAVDGVSFTLRRGETLGIVGESGSGKSTLARTLLRLDEATAGSVRFDGVDLLRAPPDELLRLRRRIQVVFQDPYASLNPRMTVGQIVAEPWSVHPGVVARSAWRDEVAVLLEKVGMEPDHARRYPHQFSGGQRQRVAIARALALRPDLIICDEAVSALDVSIQAQVIELLQELKRDFGLSYLFIAHDLPVVRDFAERVLVMHRGRIVEEGPTLEVFEHPADPYTRALLAASPVPDPEVQRARAEERQQALAF